MNDYRNSDVISMHLPKFPNMECAKVTPDHMITSDKEADQAQKKVCLMCVHRDSCLDLALSFGDVEGIWGGTNKRDRRRIISSRARQGIAPSIDETKQFVSRPRTKKKALVSA